jgi:S-adenosylmethionine:tRNA ribosyltransferase-isomerase
MKKSDLQYDFPKELIALKPERPSRVLLNRPGRSPEEIPFQKIFDLFQAGDLLVINDTKVIPSRLQSADGKEFLFIRKTAPQEWEVLFPAKSSKVGEVFDLPGGLRAELLQKGLPQKVKTNFPLSLEYFEKFGAVNLPPYIMAERGEKKIVAEDREWYQTQWAENVGSVAAPTASLHFTQKDLQALREKKVSVESLTLHVGLGTFLPLRTENLTEHQMHSEFIHMRRALFEKARAVRAEGKRVWALGTTATRSLESVARGMLPLRGNAYEGESDLFIYPPYEFQLVNGLLTNFHQPESTLLALVCAFFGTKEVKAAYECAIKERFRLFSYGDLSVWIQ